MTQPLCTWCDRASFFSLTSKKMIKLEASEIKNISFQGYLQLFPLKILLTIREGLADQFSQRPLPRVSRRPDRPPKVPFRQEGERSLQNDPHLTRGEKGGTNRYFSPDRRL